MPTDLPPGKPASAPTYDSPDRMGIALNWTALFVAIGLCFWVMSAWSFNASLDISHAPASALSADEQ